MKPSPLTVGLGVSMTVGYGTLHYSFSVLTPAIARDFGWETSFVFGVFSAGLLAGAVSAPIFGRSIDRFGARPVMVLGTLAATLALVLYAVMQNAWQFAAITFLAEFVAFAVQYDAGFAALAQRHGQEARSHVTLVTLIAGFASTVFWPLDQWLLTLMDWRDVYLVLAAINLFFALPVHLAVPAYRPPRKARMAVEGKERSKDRGAGLQMALMAISLASGGFLISAVSVSLLVVLGAAGFSPAVATLAGSLIGPSQVLARLIEYSQRRLFTPVTTALVASGALFVSFLLLSSAVALPLVAIPIVFAIVYGAGQGLTSIVRGVLPLYYFGTAGYGRTMGVLSGVRMALSAAAPVSIVFISERAGVGAAILSLLCIAGISAGTMVLLSRLRPLQASSD